MIIKQLIREVEQLTEQEAIEIIDLICKELYKPKKVQETLDIAISALKEVQQYRAIGTVEECREAMEKQNAKKPDYECDGYADGHMVYDTWICPNCGEKYEVDYDDYKHCPNCGQAILKENEDD